MPIPAVDGGPWRRDDVCICLATGGILSVGLKEEEAKTVFCETAGDPRPRVLPEGFGDWPVGGGEEDDVEIAGIHAVLLITIPSSWADNEVHDTDTRRR